METDIFSKIFVIFFRNFTKSLENVCKRAYSQILN